MIGSELLPPSRRGASVTPSDPAVQVLATIVVHIMLWNMLSCLTLIIVSDALRVSRE
jgi:hypothetical protein